MSEPTNTFIPFEQFKEEYEDTRSTYRVVREVNTVPSLRMYPTSLTFPNTSIDQESYRQVLSLVNESQQPICIEEIKCVGNFECVYELPEEVRPGHTIDIEVKFIPKHFEENEGNIIVSFKDSVGVIVADLLGSGV